MKATRIGAGREMPSPGDVVTGIAYGSEFIGRIERTFERPRAAVVRLDDGTCVDADLEELTIVESYTGPRANVVRMANGWRFRDVPLTREESAFWDDVRREKAIERAS